MNRAPSGPTAPRACWKSRARAAARAVFPHDDEPALAHFSVECEVPS